ncbi:MAG: polysulfide reductase NrfD [Bacteriovoracaceae bacterium]|nr:polysulfide reductase NrfD [Bacteriovoracaceae bacterium]
MIKEAFTGDKRYFTWLGGLSVFILFGMVAYYFQFTQGLEVTNLSDQVSWGVYIANFTFLVGVAAAAVLLVVPAYVFKMKSVKKVVLLGELLAVSAIVMCMLFIMVDMGRPDRFWHVIPFIGRLNFPKSVLAWDVVVLNGYLLLNLHIPGYLLYQLYLGKKPHQSYYLPFVYTSIFWAVSIHTVTAFLYSGLGGRPYWNAAILAPRFLISAFAGGPPLLIIIFTVINHFYKDFDIEESVFDLLKKITAVTLPINMFLLGCELFKEFYTDSTHVASAKYLFFGLHGHHLLVPYIWAAIAFSSIGMVIFLMPKYRNQQRLVLGGSVLIIIGIWIEKGMGLIIPGFVPSPLGDIVEYTPSAHEFFISLGIWAAGAMIFTLMAKSALAISSGKLRKS